MGLELIIGGISAVVGIFGAIGQANAANAAANAQNQAIDANNRAQERAAGEAREARATEAAAIGNSSLDNRRQRVREARIRRAQIIAASENAGTSKSSGQTGAIGALSTNLAGLLGNSLGEGAAAAGINAANQRGSDAITEGNKLSAGFQTQANSFQAQGAAIGAWTGAIQSGISGFSSIFDKPKTE